MKESMQLFFLLLILQGCLDTSGQKFNFTEGGLTPKANGISSAVKEFKIISQTRWEISDVDYPGNIIFDGIRIIIPIKYNLSFPGDKVT